MPVVHLILFVLALLWANPVLADVRQDARPAVEIYVKVDEMAVLRGFRDKETNAFPKPGEPRYEAYKERWQILVGETFKEIRRRVPRHVAILPATGKEQKTGLHIDVTVADMSTTCAGVDYYKYLWVRTYQRQNGMTTNWDGLGVRSQTVVTRAMSDEDRVKGDVDAWVQIWAQVPYLHLTVTTQPEAPESGFDNDSGADSATDFNNRSATGRPAVHRSAQVDSAQP